MELKNFGVLFAVLTLLTFSFAVADPDGPDAVTEVSESTKSVQESKVVTIGGGNISVINISSAVQNSRWKAFVGNATGTFTLDDSTGATIFDWSLNSITGRIYATRNSGTVDWSGIACATGPQVITEEQAMNHNDVSNQNDNITTTFDDSTHQQFYVGATSITADSCMSLNTYVNDNSQDSSFEEVILSDNVNNQLVYATVIEEDVVGYNGDTYDFQMIVPEDGAAGATTVTDYYVYIELGND